MLVAIAAFGSVSAADTNDIYVLNDTSYDTYFDAGGHFVDSVSDNTNFIVGNLTNKEFSIDRDNISLIGDDGSIQKEVTIRLGIDGETYTDISVDTPVSMNLWGF